MGRSLICAIDGSDSREAVAATGRQLADQLGDRLLLTHVVESTPRFPHGRDVHQPRDASDAERLLRSIDAERESERLVVHGDPVRELVTLAEAESADLTIIGSRGYGPAKAALLGSVARDLPRQSPCPVVVLPPKAREGGEREGALSGRTLVCGVEFSKESASAAAVAARLSSRLGLELVLVYAFGPLSPYPGRVHQGALPPRGLNESERQMQSAAARKLEEFAERTLEAEAGKCRRRVVHGLPVEALGRVSEEENAALIAVGDRGFGPVKSLLVGSTPGGLAVSAPTPIVVVPGHLS